MKAKSIFFLFVLGSIIIPGCGSGEAGKSDGTDSSNTSKSKVLKVGFGFDHHDDGTEPGNTDISLLIGDPRPEKFLIGNYVASFQDVDDTTGLEFPKGTVVACSSWYAGGGDQLAILRQGNELVVMWRPTDEPVNGGDGEQPAVVPWEAKKKLPLSEGAKIEKR